jgi:hypothetical protein
LRKNILLSIAVLAAALRVPLAAGQQTYVTVITDDEMPVTGLHSSDVVLRDGGVRQSVLDVEAASEPLSIAVVIDGFEAADVPDLARALDDAAKILREDNPRTEIVLRSGDPRSSSLTRRLAAGDVALRGFLRVAVDVTAPIAEAVASACEALKNAPTDRRVVLLFVGRRPAEDANRPERLTDALFRTRTALWTIEVAPNPVSLAGSPAAKNPASAMMDEILTAGTQVSGALREKVAGSAALPAAAGHVVALLLSQYVVTYRWPDPMLSQLTFATRHDRGAVLAPGWAR